MSDIRHCADLVGCPVFQEFIHHSIATSVVNQSLPRDVHTHHRTRKKKQNQPRWPKIKGQNDCFSRIQYNEPASPVRKTKVRHLLKSLETE